MTNASGRLGQVCELIPRERQVDCMAAEREKMGGEAPAKVLEEEEEEPKQEKQSPRGYWSSSRGGKHRGGGGSLLSLYVTDQQRKAEA